MTSTYLNKIQELIRSLEAMPNLTVCNAEIAPPATTAAIATARNYAAYRLPAGVEEFYQQMNGLRLEWEYVGEVPDNQTSDSGAIHLLPIERIFGSWKDVTWFDDFEGGDRFKAVKPFDLFQSEACAAFYQEPDAAPQDAVYFHYFGEDLCATGYSFIEYIDRLITSRGYLYWQLSLCADTQKNSEVRQFRERMPILFPDFSADAFVPRTSHQ
ncbi:hypothetical protein H6G36_17710 [Anabaena minutissima FACHB-250]|nr:hypothetical protein [Anabaena minutissima FACHB-250]